MVLNAREDPRHRNKLRQRLLPASNYPGGLREEPRALLERKPELVIEGREGMLPQNRLGRAMFRKLKVYRGASTPPGQQPATVEPAAGRTNT